ncbi:MAG: hypothetical protein WC238_01615 [Parcubacteria group bacterium]|jgi:hypothetical protein
MQNNYLKIALKASIITAVGVYVVDYFSHLLFSDPMETLPYFMAKATWYFVFSVVFLSVLNLDKRETIKVIIGAIIVASVWGAYYNILPALFDFYPFGLTLSGINFLGMGILGSGVAFGSVHIFAFIGGYYATKFIAAKTFDQK